MIIDSFIIPEEFKKIEKVTEWNETDNDWVIKHPAQKKIMKKKDGKRPQSAVGLKRPTSEYSRIAKGLGDLNPRYKFDNILQLDLDMPERTTEDYEGVPSAKVQQAIQAILQEENTKEEVAIATLVNFNDKLLDDYFNQDNKSTTGPPVKGEKNRPKSGKRPKSAKKGGKSNI